MKYQLRWNLPLLTVTYLLLCIQGGPLYRPLNFESIIPAYLREQSERTVQ